MMLFNEVPQFDPQRDGTRWVAYFDLLGMTELIRSGRHVEVFLAYQRAIERLERDRGDHSKLRHTWFSDTFMVATEDDSGPSFAQLEQVSRWFFYFMITADIPLRSAIACGPMYADFDHRIFIGSAMIEAYQYGEAQDWIGLVLCPSAETAMKRLGLPLDDPRNGRLNWSYWTPSWKKAPAGAPSRIGACVPRVVINEEDLTITALARLAAACPEKDGAKYTRAIEFIRSNAIRMPPPDERQPTDEGAGE